MEDPIVGEKKIVESISRTERIEPSCCCAILCASGAYQVSWIGF